MKRWLILIVVVVSLIVVLGGVKGFGVYKIMQGLKSQTPPKAAVSTIKAEYEDWQPSLQAVATLRAVQGADLSSEVAGIVQSIHFESGAEVKAGQLLAQLRSADDEAHLESLKASAALAALVFNRDTQQLKAQAISQATLDTSAANLRMANAQVAEQQALVDKKFVRAPFAGRVGIRAVDVGQYLNAGTMIVTLQALDPIYADFYLPQQALAQLAEGQSVNVTLDDIQGRIFAGEISAINPQVDSGTRNVQVRASLKNPDHKLLPGMYSHMGINVGKTIRYLTVPQTAVTYNPYGSTVFVVAPKHADGGAPGGENEGTETATTDAGKDPAETADLVATQVFVTTGATRGDQVAILKGVNEGDEVVTSGQIKLRNGSLVVVNNKVVPSNDPNSKPSDE